MDISSFGNPLSNLFCRESLSEHKQIYHLSNGRQKIERFCMLTWIDIKVPAAAAQFQLKIINK